MCVFSISVDKGIQSLRDDCAVFGGTHVHSALDMHLITDTLQFSRLNLTLWYLQV